MPHLPRVAAVALLTIPAILAATATGAQAAPRKITVDVGRSCMAPAPGVSNACWLRDTLPGAGIGGADLTWEVVLLFSDAWRVQLQAFSETGGECVYPVRVWGSVSTPGGDVRSFTATDPFPVAWTPAEQPSLTLAVERIRIDTAGTC